MEVIGTSYWVSKRGRKKYIVAIKPKVLKYIIFCDSNYATDNETRNSFSGLVTTLLGTLLTYSSKTHRMAMLSRIEEY